MRTFRITAHAAFIIVATDIVAVPVSGGVPTYDIIDLTEVAGVSAAIAMGINDEGIVVGSQLLPDDFMMPLLWHPDGTVSMLELLKGDNSAAAQSINNSGDVVGLSEFMKLVISGEMIFILEEPKAAQWTGATITDLNPLGVKGDPLDLTHCFDINEADQIVGWARPAGLTTGRRGFVFDNGVVTDLGDLTTGQAAAPHAVNELGQIVGVGQRFGAIGHAFLLTPVANTAPGDLDGDGVVGAGDLAILLGAWGPCPRPNDCPQDLDGDGSIGPADLALLLGAWG